MLSVYNTLILKHNAES